MVSSSSGGILIPPVTLEGSCSCSGSTISLALAPALAFALTLSLVFALTLALAFALTPALAPDPYCKLGYKGRDDFGRIGPNVFCLLLLNGGRDYKTPIPH